MNIVQKGSLPPIDKYHPRTGQYRGRHADDPQPPVYGKAPAAAILKAADDGLIFLTPTETSRLRQGLCLDRKCERDCDCDGLIRSVIAPRFAEFEEKGLV